MIGLFELAGRVQIVRFVYRIWQSVPNAMRRLLAVMLTILASSAEAQLLVRIPDRDGPVNGHVVTDWSPGSNELAVTPTLWLAFADGVHVVHERANTSEMLRGITCATSIAAANDAVWVACSQSRVLHTLGRGRTEPVHISGPEGEVLYAIGDAAHALIVTNRAIYRIVKEKATVLAALQEPVRSSTPVRGLQRNRFSYRRIGV